MTRFLIVFALLSTPVAAVAQTVSLAGTARTNSVAPVDRPRLSAEAHARIDERIMAAAEQGLPTEPMRRLADQGEARFASESRITRALTMLQADMVSARRILIAAGRKPTDSEVGSGGEAIAYGVSERELANIVRAAPKKRSLEMALSTLVALAARGDGLTGAVATIQSQLAAGASDREIRASAGLTPDLADGTPGR